MRKRAQSTVTEVMIHLAEKRSRRFGSRLQVLHSFDEHRKAFGVITKLEDCILQAKGKVEITVKPRELLLLLPIAGGLEYRATKKSKAFLDVGKALWLSGDSVAVENTYQYESINFLAVSFDMPELNSNILSEWIFDLDANSNTLVSFDIQSLNCYIGAFEGRRKGSIDLMGKEHLYVFVIQGAFEVEDRLLQQCDGLALKHFEQIEFESLSSNAVLLGFRC